MPNIKPIDANGLPSPFCDHAIVEQVDEGYQATGVCLKNSAICRLVAPVRASLDESLRDAEAWCDEHDVADVHLIEGTPFSP